MAKNRTLASAFNFRSIAHGSGPAGIFRSGTMLGLHPHDAHRLHTTLAVTTFLDLRSAREVAEQGRPEVLIAEGIRWVSHEISGFDNEAIASLYPSASSYADYYLAMLSQAGGALVEALRRIASTEGGVVFGCYAGKDRTGILAAVLHELAGADRRTILGDYLETGSAMGTSLHLFERSWRKRGISPEQYLERVRPRPETLEQLYSRLPEGGLARQLEQHGLSAETCEALRRKLGLSS